MFQGCTNNYIYILYMSQHYSKNTSCFLQLRGTNTNNGLVGVLPERRRTRRCQSATSGMARLSELQGSDGVTEDTSRRLEAMRTK